jgi:DNA repair photolyase
VKTGRRTTFVPYTPKRILNRAKRPDHWFWSRYSAYPYIGCQHGCEFCYCRERKYSPYDDPHDFAHVIKVKSNAADLLRRELSRVPVDVVFTGDYQPAERKFGLSRRLLEVCYDLGFPVFVLERSPLVVRDLELIQSIHEHARAVVAFSILSTPDAPSAGRVREIERLAPPAEKRFEAMAQIARRGIVTGTCLMPVLPGLSDDDETLRRVVAWTQDHGGQFVLTGSLTLADQQRDYFFGVLRERFADVIPLYDRLYPTGSYGPSGDASLEVARRVRELCREAGLADRIPRPVIPGEKRALNKRIAEALANRAYDLELEGEPRARVWDYRKSAWAIEDLEQEVGLVYDRMGARGLESISGVAPGLAGEVERLIQAIRHRYPEEARPRSPRLLDLTPRV